MRLIKPSFEIIKPAGYTIDDMCFLCVPNYNADKGAVPVMLKREK